MSSKRLAIALALLVTVATLSVTPALAGGKGKGHGVSSGDPNGGSPSAVLTVTPDPALAQSTVTVTGSGFEPNNWVSITMVSPGCCLGFNVWADESGNVSFSRMTGAAGTYQFDAYQWNGQKYVLKASVSFAVQ